MKSDMRAFFAEKNTIKADESNELIDRTASGLRGAASVGGLVTRRGTKGAAIRRRECLSRRCCYPAIAGWPRRSNLGRQSRG